MYKEAAMEKNEEKIDIEGSGNGKKMKKKLTLKETAMEGGGRRVCARTAEEDQ